MTADETLFRHRFWVFGALFFVAFSSSSIDHVNVVAAVLLCLDVDPRSPEFDDLARGVFGVGALLAVLAALLRTWATAYLGSDVMHGASARTERLVADGPYRHVRNPLYLGVLLLAFASAFAASTIGAAVILVGATTLVLRLIVHEEAGLAAAQGAAFDSYRRAVPRLVPSLRPRVPASDRRPRVGQAVLGELFFWVFAVTCVAFALTEDGVLCAEIAAGGMLVYMLARWIAARLQRRVAG